MAIAWVSWDWRSTLPARKPSVSLPLSSTESFHVATTALCGHFHSS